MSKTCLPLLALVGILAVSCSEKNVAGVQPPSAPPQPSDSEIFPLSVGNEWRFRKHNDSTTIMWKVVGTTTKNDNSYFIVQCGFSCTFDSMYLRNDEQGRVWQYIDGKEAVWLDFTRTHNESYAWQATEEPSEYVVTVQRKQTAETFLQTFNDCFDFFFDLPGPVDDEYGYTVAPGYGVVILHGAWIYAKLESAVIN